MHALRWCTAAIMLAAACAPAPAPEPPPNATGETAPRAPLPDSAALQPATHGDAKAASDDGDAPEPPAADVLPPPLPKGTVVLHVGDSMADALGKSLNRELDKRGIKGYLEAKEATYIPQWAGFKMELDQHIARRKPDLVIITLGGNEVKMPDPTERIDAIKRLVKKVGDRPCLWIAAPLWPGLTSTGILEVIREHCAPCHYVDTNELLPDLERLGDGVHPTIPERRRWAAFMIRWMLHNRDPSGERPWDFKERLSAPPSSSDQWLETR